MRAPTPEPPSLDEHLTLPPPAPSRVFRAVNLSDLCVGPNAVGKVGDWVLDNGVVRAVVDDVQSGGGGFALSGGQLVDLARHTEGRAGPDELGQVFNYLGSFPRQLRYESSTSALSPEGVASVTVRGVDPRTPGLRGETTYRLRPGTAAIELDTTITFDGDSPTEVGLGDAIQWAGAEHWVPGIGHAVRGEQRFAWIAGVGRGVVYALVADGSTGLFGPSGSAWTNPMVRRVTLARGESARYVRRLGVAGPSAVDEALRSASYGPTGMSHQIRVRVDDPDGRPFAGARVELLDTNGAPHWMASSGSDGMAVLRTPAGLGWSLPAGGSWRVSVRAEGRAVTVANNGAVQLPSGGPESVVVDAHVGRAGALRLRVFEANAAERQPVAARVIVYGVSPTPDPVFGPSGRGDGARNSVLVSPREPVRVALGAGTYRVVATHGPMHTLAEQQVVLNDGEEANVDLTVTRVIDTTRTLVCGDFHTHQAPSLDSPVSLRDRVLAAAAEGLDVLAATDHNVATNLAGAITEEALTGVLHSMGGDEVSTDVAVQPTGHWNLYPFDVDPSRPRNGAPDLFELSPEQLIARVRETLPGAVIQLNHPRAGSPTGMFDVYQLDPQTGRAARPGFSARFDALEVWNGRYQRQSEGVLRDWLALLRAGATLTGVANSDSHLIVTQEVGYPRTCMPIAATERGAGLDASVVRSLRVRRDALMTDGPVITVWPANSRQEISVMGQHIVPPRAGLLLRVRAESVSWAPADILERVRADATLERIPGAVVSRTANTVVVEATVRVFSRDEFVLFRVRGEQPVPVLVGDPPMVPMALTNPLFLRR
ncbi:MAG: CehA/McbA family metallohydrolase [Deltaproteobacteria bacterium]|nr:CehA/McbA family metallohydrolase [Deltaproteobacteria bacterium]